MRNYAKCGRIRPVNSKIMCESTIVSEKRWKCCDHTTSCCYTLRNVVFDEALSWWSPQRMELPNSENLEDRLHGKQGSWKKKKNLLIQRLLRSWGSDEPMASPSRTLEESMIPWHTGVHQRSPKDVRLIPPIRRSARQKKPNPKYADASLTK